jgi:hypothetical protein
MTCALPTQTASEKLQRPNFATDEGGFLATGTLQHTEQGIVSGFLVFSGTVSWHSIWSYPKRERS